MDTENIDARGDLARLNDNEFYTSTLEIGQISAVQVDGERVAVYNAEGRFFATQDRCPHTGWSLSDGGELIGSQVTCPLHYWCFDVSDGSVVRGIKTLKLTTYRVLIEGAIGRVVLES